MSGPVSVLVHDGPELHPVFCPGFAFGFNPEQVASLEVAIRLWSGEDDLRVSPATNAGPLSDAPDGPSEIRLAPDRLHRGKPVRGPHVLRIMMAEWLWRAGSHPRRPRPSHARCLLVLAAVVVATGRGCGAKELYPESS